MSDHAIDLHAADARSAEDRPALFNELNDNLQLLAEQADAMETPPSVDGLSAQLFKFLEVLVGKHVEPPIPYVRERETIIRFLKHVGGLHVEDVKQPNVSHAIEIFKFLKIMFGDLAADMEIDFRDAGECIELIDYHLQHLTGMYVNDIETLSPNVRKRIDVLKYLQNEYNKLENKFLEERDQLHDNYQKFYEPLYIKRYEIVNGDIDIEGITNEAAIGEENKAAEGVPGFWLTAMKINEILAEVITERDEDALKYLEDIKCCKLDNPRGFKLEFYFDSNPYFQNSVLTKTYHVVEDDPKIEKSTGTETEWHPGKCLTQKVLKKKPKKRAKYSKRIIKTENCESFFNIFNPPPIPEDDDDDVDELQNLMDHDYRISSTIQHKIIPHALSWFTGEAVQIGYLSNVKQRVEALKHLKHLQLSDGEHVNVKETLSPNVWQRIVALKYLQHEYDILETKFLEERVQLEAKYQKLYEPLYTKRYEIVNGVIDVEGITIEAAEEKGVPGFRLAAMKTHITLAEQITERDEEALKYLKDIKFCKLYNPYALKLEFYFESNPYFQNSVLSKTYHMIEDNVPIIEKITGTEIEWNPGKCLTHKGMKMMPRKGSQNAKWIVAKLWILEKYDYDVGYIIRGEIIPNAVSWFTGEALHGDFEDTEVLMDDLKRMMGKGEKWSKKRMMK